MTMLDGEGEVWGLKSASTGALRISRWGTLVTALATILLSACGNTPTSHRTATSTPTPDISLPLPITPSTMGSPSPTPSPAHSKSAAPAAHTSSPTHPPSTRAPARGGRPHILVVMEENHGYSGTLGKCSQDPYLCSLASGYASATGWYGVTHPSEPNYVAIGSGGIQGCTSDSSCAADSLSATDLGGQLTAADIPWVDWQESMPSACYTGGASGNYALKHNPFGFFRDNYSGACHIQPYPGASAAVSVLDGANAPDFVWITPNLQDDMHNGTVTQGDNWLQANLPGILTSSWFRDYASTVIVTMDEGDGSANAGSCCGGAGSGGHIPMVVISSRAHGRRNVSLAGDHYGTLRSIEEAFRLGLLGQAASAGNGDLSSLFG